MSRTSRRVMGVGFALSLVAGPALVSAQRTPADATIAVQHVTVIDVATGNRAPDQTVVVRGSRIVAVGPAASVQAPAGAAVVDGTGKFLIPGMWDMHAHPLHNIPEKTLPLAVTRGITGIRDMGGGIQHLADITRRIDEGMIAPRLMVAGPLLDGTPQGAGFPPGTGVTITTPDEGRETVNRLVAQRVHLLKIHNGLTRETYLAIAEEAKRWKLPFEGHLPVGMTIVEASDAGQRTVEHIGALGPMCARNPDDLRPPARGTPPPPTPTTPIELDQAKCEAALRRLASNGTWLTPTIGAPGSGNQRQRIFNLALVRMAAKAGVGLLPGTDWPGGGYWRGQYNTIDRSVQDDLAGMVEAGLSLLEGLRIATVNPARLFGLQDQLGLVATGYLADLVVLDADPLADITNTKRVSAVIANGRLVNAQLRQRLIDDELASRKPAPPPASR